MNHQQTIDHELRLFNQFRSEGKKLVHFCDDWDGMVIHSEMDEISACCCDFVQEDDKILRNDRAEEVNQKRMAEVKFEDRLGPENITRIIEPRREPYPAVIGKITTEILAEIGAPAHSGTDDLKNEVALVCMIVSNPGGGERPIGWQKRVNDLLRGMRHRIVLLEAKINASD